MSRRPEGFWEALAASSDLWSTAAACDLPLADLRAFFELVAAHPRMVTLFSQGANQSIRGTDKGNAIINLHLATGRINQPGAGPFTITGQPNAMGGREVGGLANMLACHLGFSRRRTRRRGAVLERAATSATGPGLKAVDMFRAVHDGRIKFLWVMATNPAVSMPDAGFVREALARCPTVVVSDCHRRYRHRPLRPYPPARARPGARRTARSPIPNAAISRQRALFAAPGEARADWRIVCDVASAMGWGEAFAFASPADVFREYAAMTALAVKHGKAARPDRPGRDLSDWDYEAMEPFQWGGEHPLAARLSHALRQGAAGGGRARLKSAADPDFPLRLNTGALPRPVAHDDPHRPVADAVAAPPRAAARSSSRRCRGAGPGRWRAGAGGHRAGRGSVPRRRSATASGAARCSCRCTGPIAMSGEGRSNRLPGQGVDPHSGQPGFKDTPARVEPLSPNGAASWSRAKTLLPADLLYWTRVARGGRLAFRTGGRWHGRCRCAAARGRRGWKRPIMRAACGGSRCAMKTACSSAALYVTRSGNLPPRDWAAAQLGQAEASAAELLAGRPSTPAPDRGADRLRLPRHRRTCDHGGGLRRRGDGRGHRQGDLRRHQLRLLPPGDRAAARSSASGGRACLKAIGRSIDFPEGSVWLVGAGPGDPELLTRKAERLIRAASVIFHDALVGPGVLDLAAPAARLVYVGKRSGRHSKDQQSIDQLIVAAALAGERVVRLKGGDPSIFGRATEELEACRAAGVPVRICPGITAASAAAASLGASLTLRGLARKLTFVTAHARAGEALDLDWQALADPQATLAVYMGKAAAARDFRAADRRRPARLEPRWRWSKTPACRASGSLHTRLDLLPLAARSALGDGPALLLIGEAMKPRHVLDQASEFSERTDLRLRAHDRKPARQPGTVPIY